MKLFKLRSNPDTDATTQFSARLGSSVNIKPGAKIAFKSIYLDGSVRDTITLESSISFTVYSAANYSQVVSVPSGTYTRNTLMKVITDGLNTSYYMGLIQVNGVYVPKIVKSNGTDAKIASFLGMDWNVITDAANNYKTSIAFNCSNDPEVLPFIQNNVVQNGGTYTTQTANDGGSYAISQTSISRGCNYVSFVLSALPAPAVEEDIVACSLGIYDGVSRIDNEKLNYNDYDCSFVITTDNKVSVWNKSNESFTYLNVVATAGMRFYILSSGNTYKFVIVKADGTEILGLQGQGVKQFTNGDIYCAFTIYVPVYALSTITSVNSPYDGVNQNNIITYTPTMDFGVKSSKVGGGKSNIEINFIEPVDTRILQNILGYSSPTLIVAATQFTFKSDDRIDSDNLEDVSIAIQNLDISSYDTSKSVGFKCATIMTIDSLAQTVSAGGAYSYDVPTPIFIEMNNTQPISLSSFLVRITSQNIPLAIPNGVCSITVLIDDSEK
jgi:hypothetical protein